MEISSPPVSAAERFRAGREKKRQRTATQKAAQAAAVKERRRKERAELARERERSEAEARRRESLRQAAAAEARIQELQAKQRAELLERLGKDMPSDPLEVSAEMGQILAHTMRMAAADPSGAGREQRRELLAIVKAYQTTIPDSRRLLVERKLREAQERQHTPKAPPKLEPAPATSTPLQMPART